MASIFFSINKTPFNLSHEKSLWVQPKISIEKYSTISPRTRLHSDEYIVTFIRKNLFEHIFATIADMNIQRTKSENSQRSQKKQIEMRIHFYFSFASQKRFPWRKLETILDYYTMLWALEHV